MKQRTVLGNTDTSSLLAAFRPVYVTVGPRDPVPASRLPRICRITILSEGVVRAGRQDGAVAGVLTGYYVRTLSEEGRRGGRQVVVGAVGASAGAADHAARWCRCQRRRSRRRGRWGRL